VITVSTTAGNPDYATAAHLFERAARHGLRDSQYNLGVLYESGLGVAKDHAAAYKWYALAARSGDSIAARRRDSLIARLPSQTIQAVDTQIAAWQPEPANEAAIDARAFGAAHVQRRADAGHR
jgi:localization factor PodJL